MAAETALVTSGLLSTAKAVNMVGVLGGDTLGLSLGTTVVVIVAGTLS